MCQKRTRYSNITLIVVAKIVNFSFQIKSFLKIRTEHAIKPSIHKIKLNYDMVVIGVVSK